MTTPTPGGQPARHPRPHPLAKRPDETYDDWARRVGPMPDHLVTLVREALLKGRVT